MGRVYIDVESVGLHGVPVLLQYAFDDGPVQLWDIWTNPIIETMGLIYEICQHDVIGFNLSFDWFHINKLYTMFSLFPDSSVYPSEHIDELGILEEKARFVDLVCKPKRALDLMLVARRGPYQSLMERDDIRIKKIPTQLSYELAKHLNKTIQFDNIYFARNKDPFAPRWKILDRKLDDGRDDFNFKDIKLSFRASTALKALARHIGLAKPDEIISFADIEVNPNLRPDELGYAPWALAVAPKGPESGWIGSKLKNGKSKKTYAWPARIQEHILHWGYNHRARQYASNDVEYTRGLCKHFGDPEPGDNDSELTITVACCRWKGYKLDLPKVNEQKEIALAKIKKVPHAPHKVKQFIFEVLSPSEKLAFGNRGTKKVILEEISTWLDDNENPHPAAQRAADVLDARKSKKKIELLDKLIKAGRFHASFKVMGALSNRMSGADGLNAQGIDHTTPMRACFVLFDDDCVVETSEGNLQHLWALSGGDFKSFEVSIAVKVFDDEPLNQALLSGKKIHAIFAMELFPGQSYEQILASEGKDPDMYDKGKKGVFLTFYGGDENTLLNKLGIPLEIGKRAFTALSRKHPGIGRFQSEINDAFQCLIQPRGIGTAISWKEPKEYCETFLGFRRYFTLEYRVCKALFELAQSPPVSWKSLKIKVVRFDRVQTAVGALQSALYGAAFRISSGIVRAAKNHTIQSPGAEIAKAVQRAIWDLQPSGVNVWIVQPFNVHDEIMCPTRRGYEDQVQSVVAATVAKYKKIVPLLAIDWFKRISNWAMKKG